MLSEKVRFSLEYQLWKFMFFSNRKKNSFDCKHLDARDAKKCYLKGKTFSSGDNVDDLLLSGSCEGACRCVDNKFICAHIDCPERFGPRPEVGCVRKYGNDKCCAVEIACGNFDSFSQ